MPLPVLAVVGVALLQIVFSFSREPQALFAPQLWAEDGPIFFKEQHDFGLRALFISYQGYLHLYPRLVAFLASYAPLAWTPAIYLWGNIVAQLAVGAACVSTRIPGRPLTRAAMALAVSGSAAQNEVFNKLTNAQWILALLPLLLLSMTPPTGKREFITDAVLVLLLGLTGPFSVVFLPLFLVVLLVRRTAHSATLFGANLVAALVQLVGLKLTRAPTESLSTPMAFIRAWSTLFGRLWFGAMGRPPPASAVLDVLLCLLSLLVLGWLTWLALRKGRPAIALWLWGGLSVLLAGFWVFRGSVHHLDGSAERYFYLPIVGIVWSFLGARELVETVAQRLLCILAVAVQFLVFATNPRSGFGPSVRYDWRRSSSCVETPGPCEVPVNPPPWKFNVN